MAKHGQGSGGRPAAVVDLPLAEPAKPFVGGVVLVRTPTRINGQFEHAAIVTGLPGGMMVDVTLFPRGEASYAIDGIHHSDPVSLTRITWRWPQPA